MKKISQKFRFLLRKHISSEIQILCCSISNLGEIIQGLFAMFSAQSVGGQPVRVHESFGEDESSMRDVIIDRVFPEH